MEEPVPVPGDDGEKVSRKPRLNGQSRPCSGLKRFGVRTGLTRPSWKAAGVLLVVMLAGLHAAHAEAYSGLSNWFSKPESERGPLPAEVQATLEDAAAARVAAAKVWEIYRSGAQILGRDRELPPMPRTLEQGEALPAADRPEPSPRNLSASGKEMPFLLLAKGAKGTNGWPLFLALHGGGRSSQKVEPHGWGVNTREWQAQVRLFQTVYPPGLYLIPRMADDNDGRWSLRYCQALYDRAIRLAILFREADPDRVCIMGISEGGYAAYRLGAHMADRWAASCSMAAAEPFDTSPPENFRNLPFACSIGENDRMFDRIGLARAFFARLEELRRADGGAEAYVNWFDVQAGRGHGVSYREGPAWIARFVRQPWPDRVVWKVQPQDGAVRRQFYWLALDEAPGNLPLFLEARSAANTIDLTAEQADAAGKRLPAKGVRLRVYLNDQLANLEKPVKVVVNGKVLHDAKVTRQLAVLARSLDERGDPRLMFPAEIEIGL